MIPYTDPEELLLQFTKNLNQRSIVYGYLGKADSFPHSVGNDVDFWVKDGEQAKFLEALFSIAYQTNWAVIRPNVSPRIRAPGEGKYYLIQKEEPFAVLHIDIWTFPHWRGIPYIDIKDVEESISFHPSQGIYVVSATVYSVISLLKYLLHDGRVNNKHKKYILDTVLHNEEQFISLLSASLGLKLAVFIAEQIKQEKWENIERRVSVLRRSLVWNALRQKPFRQLKNWGSYGREVIRLFIKQYGLLLVLIGPDGVGKTTLATALIESQTSMKLFDQRYYFHTKFPTLPPLRSITTSLRKQNSISEVPARQIVPLAPWRCWIYPFYYGVGYVLGYFWLIKTRARGGRLVVFDRYYYEYFVQEEFSNCPKWLLKVISYLVPKPDVLFFLKDEPDRIYERKQELPLSIIKKQLEAYKDFTLVYSGRNEIIEVNVGEAGTLKQAMRAMISILCDKYAL